MPQNKRLCVAKITSAHGIKGLVKLTCYAEDPGELEQYGPLYTEKQGEQSLSIALKNPIKGQWLVEIQGVSDRNAAEALRGTKLYIDRDVLPDIEEDDAFYIEDMEGMEVRDTDGNYVGALLKVENFGAGDLLEIKPSTGESFYTRFTKEDVPEVHMDQGYLIITMPEEPV